MTDATELDEAAVRAAVEQADGTQWTEEWWRCHASGYFQAAMGGAPDLVSYFNTITPTTMRRLLAALDEARAEVAEIAATALTIDRERMAAEFALAAVKALADEWESTPGAYVHHGSVQATAWMAAKEQLRAALATPTTTEGGEGS